MSKATTLEEAAIQIPAKGWSKEEVMSALMAFKSDDLKSREGRVFGYTYDVGGEAEKVMKEAYMMFLSENALDITSFPSVMKIEREVVRMVAGLLRGDEHVVGNITSGGTESVLMAMKTARDHARAHKPHIKEPEVVLPRTAHQSFHKACHYFNIKPVVAEFDTVTFQADLADMRSKITPNTIMLVGSACNYGYGVIDPIEEIAAMAQEHGLLCHVDGCVGAIHFSFLRRMGRELPAFDFTVPGVTSISADMHKYGFAPKNASVILYRDKALRRHQVFACSLTNNYALVNTTMLSSKSGGPAAGCWAALKFMGEQGYQDIMGRLMETKDTLVNGINAIPGLRVLGNPDMCMFCFASDKVNVFQLQTEVKKRGWYIQPQLSTALSPANLHISVIPSVVGNEHDFLKDLAAAHEALANSPDQLDYNAVKDMVNGLIAGLSLEDAKDRLQQLAGMDSGGIPDDFSLINTVIDVLPDELSDYLLEDFINEMFV
jgi:glutamate/tyrosine decarboxylase-like PLP-dependent enzyme